MVIENNKNEKYKPFNKIKSRPCVFEYIYFARPDSLLMENVLMSIEKRLGQELAKESSVEADMVVPVPDSGVPAAIGFSQSSNLKFELGLIRNHYVGRTFIEPTQNIRSFGVKLKLSSQNILKNKSIVLIDDSLVRGTTCSKIVTMLYKAGAKEVHVRIACPEIKIYPDFYGVDMPTKKELLSSNKNTQRKFVNF